jgi:hypothetical protein
MGLERTIDAACDPCRLQIGGRLTIEPKPRYRGASACF